MSKLKAKWLAEVLAIFANCAKDGAEKKPAQKSDISISVSLGTSKSGRQGDGSFCLDKIKLA